MDELSAALGVAQLERIEELIARREQVEKWCDQHLLRVDGLIRPGMALHTTRMRWLVYLVRLAVGLERNEVIEELAQPGTPGRPYFAPIHLQPF